MRCEECLPVIDEYLTVSSIGYAKKPQAGCENCEACAAITLRELVKENQNYQLYDGMGGQTAIV